ncbi:SigE family RNA polymerase sigma factor [Spirillospora albida]|uniref:SigE family RNA polymerase sigma factor n=1 Tax=Spirillospora albida TaxID=58123 RepID=UPI00056A8281|nr:SigE family RNA polymerase sigma factor [Spirillospora albida]
MDVDFREWAAVRLPALLRYAHLLTGDRHQAEDVVQTALVRMLVAWPRVQRKDDPEGYARRTITRLAIDSRKARWRERLTDAPPERPVGPAPDEDRWEMWEALAALPRRQRAVVVLRYYEDLSEEQIADVLGCSRGTVKSQASKALAKLRARFEAAEVAR